MRGRERKKAGVFFYGMVREEEEPLRRMSLMVPGPGTQGQEAEDRDWPALGKQSLPVRSLFLN